MSNCFFSLALNVNLIMFLFVKTFFYFFLCQNFVINVIIIPEFYWTFDLLTFTLLQLFLVTYFFNPFSFMPSYFFIFSVCLLNSFSLTTVFLLSLSFSLPLFSLIFNSFVLYCFLLSLCGRLACELCCNPVIIHQE